MLFVKYFPLLSLHIQTLSSYSRPRKYTINERKGPDLRPEVCYWLILCYIKKHLYWWLPSVGQHVTKKITLEKYTQSLVLCSDNHIEWSEFFLALLNYNIWHETNLNKIERKCTLEKVNDEPFVIYLRKMSVSNPFSDIKIFLLVPGVWLPTKLQHL